MKSDGTRPRTLRHDELLASKGAWHHDGAPRITTLIAREMDEAQIREEARPTVRVRDDMVESRSELNPNGLARLRPGEVAPTQRAATVLFSKEMRSPLVARFRVPDRVTSGCVLLASAVFSVAHRP